MARRRMEIPQVSESRPCGHSHLLLLVLPALPVALAAQEVTLRVDVKLVTVFVNVTDKNGAMVGGLTREDFQVAEDGRPQKIALFEKQSELPLNLTLAIDTSGSVHKDMAAGDGRGAALRARAHAPAGQDEPARVRHRRA